MQEYTIKPGQLYYHFKRKPEQGVEHGAYLVLGLAHDMEDRSKTLVVIKPLYYCNPRNESEEGISYFVRSLELFTDSVDRPEHNYNGPRFTLITDERIIHQLQAYPLFSSKYLDA